MSRWTVAPALLAGTLAFSFALADGLAAPKKPRKGDRAPHHGAQGPARPHRCQNLPDLKVAAIRFALGAPKAGKSEPTLRIIVFVVNDGGVAFAAPVSPPFLLLQMKAPGGQPKELRKWDDFREVTTAHADGTAVGSADWQVGRPFRHEIEWDSASLGEFPPEFMAGLRYDPDQHLDATTENDDCNKDNNSATRNAAIVNEKLGEIAAGRFRYGQQF